MLKKTMLILVIMPMLIGLGHAKAHKSHQCRGTPIDYCSNITGTQTAKHNSCASYYSTRNQTGCSYQEAYHACHQNGRSCTL